MCDAAAARRRRRRGYTAVEVLIAMTVMSIGAAAVISMQRASVMGNLDARKSDIANTIARTWVERLQRDAMQWTQPGPANPTGNNLANALVLSDALTQGNWIQPNEYLATWGWSAGFDILGRDIPTSDALSGAIFCTNVRLTWLTTAQDLIHADVRVVWARGIATTTAAQGPCTLVASANPDTTRFQAIYLTTALRGNPQ
ncbi:MAG TPA: prepilin-type N-terminal cleavage/methylation domain-containing protein [Polyangiaceae bacterium]|jgi:prepilin-type N-terminal cleavage/methylation domain-containing protein